MRVDLHIHSTASDGRWSPEQLVHNVRHTGIDLFALTDHDSIANVIPVEQEMRGSGLCFIRAVEISATLDGYGFHIVGYGIDPDRPALLRTLAQNRDRMESINMQSIDKLIGAGYDISHPEYEAYEDDPTRGGWKALNLFIDKGFCSDVDGYFQRLFTGDLALDMPAFCPAENAIRVIHEAGGLAICAHPAHSAHQELARLGQLVAQGLDGLECYSPYHDDRTTRRLVGYCRQRGLLITAGSDCHGGFASRKLGQPEVYADHLNLGPLLDHIIR
jgi:predicted metal-dependent phosphoesterase TrpH